MTIIYAMLYVLDFIFIPALLHNSATLNAASITPTHLPKHMRYRGTHTTLSQPGPPILDGRILVGTAASTLARALRSVSIHTKLWLIDP